MRPGMTSLSPASILVTSARCTAAFAAFAPTAAICPFSMKISETAGRSRSPSTSRTRPPEMSMGEVGIKNGLCAYDSSLPVSGTESGYDFLGDACLGDIRLGDVCDCAGFVMRCTDQFVDVADSVFFEVLGQIRERAWQCQRIDIIDRAKGHCARACRHEFDHVAEVSDAAHSDDRNFDRAIDRPDHVDR